MVLCVMVSGSGEIDQDELEDPLTSLGLAFSRRDVEDLIASVDEDGTGEIGFEEFFEVVSRKTARGKENPLQTLYHALASGALGDRHLHLSVLIAAYRCVGRPERFRSTGACASRCFRCLPLGFCCHLFIRCAQPSSTLCRRAGAT